MDDIEALKKQIQAVQEALRLSFYNNDKVRLGMMLQALNRQLRELGGVAEHVNGDNSNRPKED